jgi:alpha-1,3-mannosyl-glycoprotein beta-1,2-N-acetylglucosaminyltransferase
VQEESRIQSKKTFAEEFDRSKSGPSGPAGNTNIRTGEEPIAEITAKQRFSASNSALSLPALHQQVLKIAPTVQPSPPPPVNVASELGGDTMLLIICANRPEYLKKTLEAVVKYRPAGLPIFVSQDSSDAAVEKLIKGTFLHLQLSSPDVQFIHKQRMDHSHYENGYFRLAAHYKWALDQVFSTTGVHRVIILEEDLVIAPDFFELFAATAHLLDSDPMLLAVSAWNDNGMAGSVRDPAQLYRSDFFPGLGWMMPKRIWDELSPKWPRAYWDDWLREPKQRQGRHIIRPEICRTFHIGQKGVSNAQYSAYLNSIRLNENAVAFTKMDLSYLALPKWDDIYLNQVRAATLISLEDARSGRGLINAKRQGVKEVKVVYGPFEGHGNSYSALAEWSGAMDNVKAGVPRTAYKGIVTVWKGEVKVHLVPASFQ